MTSGQFHSLSIDSIIIGGRQRRELTKIDELADSINRLGLINPILVNRETSELVAGERRLAACKSLGWTNITAQYQDEIDPLQLKLLELEENVKRVDLPWQDQCRAVADYHELKKSFDPTWTAAATAKSLGAAEGEISERISVAKEMASNPKIATTERYSIARNTTRRINERRAEAEAAAVAPLSLDTDVILNTDFDEWASSYTGTKFNFLHCDFPYGINANKMNQGGSRLEHGDYDDSPDVYWSLLETLARNLDNICAESCHIMFWFSMDFYTETQAFFAERTDFIIDPFPLYWLKSDNIGLLPDPQRGPRRIVETALFGRRGDRKIISAVSNGVALPTTGRAHMSEKAPLVLEHFFRMIVDKTTRMLDPTCGSGGAIRVAETLGASMVLGIEKNEEFARRAKIEYMKEKDDRLI